MSSLFIVTLAIEGFCFWLLWMVLRTCDRISRLNKRHDRRMLAMRTMALITSDRLHAGRPT